MNNNNLRNLNNLFNFIDDVDEIGLRRPQVYKKRPNYFDLLTDEEFVGRFRLTKSCVIYLLGLINEKLKTATDRNMAITPMSQLLLTLRFYALGTMLISVADMFGVSVSSACLIVKKVSFAIAELRSSFLTIPDDIEQTKLKMFEVARFPLIFGAIDCTHIRIQSPGGRNAEMFRNRKGYFSLNVQALVDSDLKFMDIVARWPGSTHDSTIFRNSRLHARLESGEFQNIGILGDSGYSLKPYMLTPIQNPTGQAEMLYNESQIRSRNIVERTFGVWKRRFPILSLGMRVQLKTVQTIIIATAIIHNMCRDRNEDMSFDDFEIFENLNEAEDCVINDNNLNIHNQDSMTRDLLVNNYFARL